MEKTGKQYFIFPHPQWDPAEVGWVPCATQGTEAPDAPTGSLQGVEGLLSQEQLPEAAPGDRE